ncbi:MAG: alpha-amylase [Chlorobiaceae bacterium]|nr:alpha-amylase [Chlorobiaceae bacterium]
MSTAPLQDDAPVQRSLADIDLENLTAARSYHPSPSSWEDGVLYFLMLDRFSDGHEFGGFSDRYAAPVDVPGAGRTTPLFSAPADNGNAPRDAWFEAGRGWCGGTIAGLKDKLGYLSRLGVTAVWVSPVFRQVTGSGDYHGYGIQNFLDVDPHFGTREELREFVAAAHESGIRVILDIIVNHAGDVFAYRDNQRRFYQDGRQWPVDGYRLRRDDPGSVPFGEGEGEARAGAWPDGAVWPVEFQQESTWSRRGEIRDWDGYPEYLDGDFCSLKEIDLGTTIKDPASSWDLLRRIREFRPSEALDHLVKVYRYWIALTDIDGFRLDTVKHMEPGAVRYFVTGIHEFAQSIGKENFAVIGEITGGRSRAIEILDKTGLDAALGIDDLPDKLEFLAKGQRSPGHPDTIDQEGYFDLFMNSLLDGKNSHQWYSKHIVTMIDDHDQVGLQRKYRFCGDNPESSRRLKLALGLNLATAGIPCIYYGTEQAFDGADLRSGDDSFGDVFMRECMFGGQFGTHQSQGRHFFDEGHEVYRFVGRLCELRNREIALRRGRQYLRQVSESGRDGDFWYPQPVNGNLFWVVAWSRIMADSECLCAINTSLDRTLTVSVVIDRKLHEQGRPMTCVLSTDESQEGLAVPIEWKGCGATVRITVPSGGFVVYR